MDSAIQRIILNPVDCEIGFPNTYPLNSDFSDGLRYPTFEQPWPVGYVGKAKSQASLSVGQSVMSVSQSVAKLSTVYVVNQPG